MEGIVSEVAKSVGTSVVLVALGWLWLKFSTRGQATWVTFGKTDGLRSIAVVGAFGFVLALGALSTVLVGVFARPRQLSLHYEVGPVLYAKQHVSDANFEAIARVADCPSGYALMNAFCQVGGDDDPRPAGGGNLQNFGLTKRDGAYHCVWNGVSDPKIFRAWIQPVCARIVSE
jgi:hypothetical protein